MQGRVKIARPHLQQEAPHETHGLARHYPHCARPLDVRGAGSRIGITGMLCDDKGRAGGLFMRIVQTSLDERRIWGRCFRSYDGATATGMEEGDMEPLIEGGLCALVPLHGRTHVKDLWEAAGLPKDDPQSGWHQIDRFNYFGLDVVTYKFRPRLFSPCRWFTNYGLLFMMNKDMLGLSRDMLSFDKLGCSNTASIAETCLLIDRTLLFEWPFVSQEQALA